MNTDDIRKAQIAELAAPQEPAAAPPEPPAPPLEVVDPTTGKAVRTVRMKLPFRQVQQVMALPPDARMAMAESLLAERAHARQKAAKAEAEKDAAKRTAKAKRKLQKASKRRNR